MPKIIFTDIPLQEEEPDRCMDCPLLGLIPKEERLYGRQQSHVCLGTRESLSERLIRAKRTDKDHKHRLDRPCTRSDLWQVWQEKEPLPGKMRVRTVDYNRYRLAYVQSGQMQIKFRKPREPSRKMKLNPTTTQLYGKTEDHTSLHPRTEEDDQEPHGCGL